MDSTFAFLYPFLHCTRDMSSLTKNLYLQPSFEIKADFKMWKNLRFNSSQPWIQGKLHELPLKSRLISKYAKNLILNLLW